MGLSKTLVSWNGYFRVFYVLIAHALSLLLAGFGFCSRTFVNGLTGNVGSRQPTGANSLNAGLRTGLGMIFTNAIADQRPMIDAFGGNAYMNEAAPTLDNAFEYVPRFWGEHWPRLLATKAKYDPNYIFRCQQCVPSL